jgi:hypothetical protein
VHFVGSLTTPNNIEDTKFPFPSKDTSFVPSAPPAYADIKSDCASPPAYAASSSSGMLRLRRHVENYQWSERKEEAKDTVRYVYNKSWTSGHTSSESFQLQSDHNNPEPLVHGECFQPSELLVGPFQVDATLLSRLADSPAPIVLPTTLHVGPGRKVVRHGDWLYIIKTGADPSLPGVGDARVKHTGIAQGLTVSVIGRQTGGRWLAAITPDPSAPNSSFGPFLYDGAVPAQAILASETRGVSSWLWVVRIVGLIANILGMKMVVEPLAQVASVLPSGLGSLVGLLASGSLVAPLSVTFGGLTMAGAYIHARARNVALRMLVLVGWLVSVGMSLSGVYRLNKYLLSLAARAAKSGASAAGQGIGAAVSGIRGLMSPAVGVAASAGYNGNIPAAAAHARYSPYGVSGTARR